MNKALNNGLALFNKTLFFDAHEALEDVWRESPKGSHLRRHLQGLVQLAVAFHHESKDNFVGAHSVLERAMRNLAGAEESLPELDLDRLRADVSPWREYLGVKIDRGIRPKRPRIRRLKRDE